MSSDNVVRFGVIGCGWISDVHMASMMNIPEIKLIAVSDIIEERAKSIAEMLGGAKTYTDYREMIRNESLDAVDICLPHHLHKDAIIELLRLE